MLKKKKTHCFFTCKILSKMCRGGQLFIFVANKGLQLVIINNGAVIANHMRISLGRKFICGPIYDVMALTCRILNEQFKPKDANTV